MPASTEAADPWPAIAKLGYVHDVVERQVGDGWARVSEGAPLHPGDRLRTGRSGSARIDFPWLTIAIGGATCVSVPRARVLSVQLEEGRLEQVVESGEVIKTLAGEATIRGAGRVVVRREGGRTLVSALAGEFAVAARGRVVTLAEGQGAIVAPGQPPGAPAPLPVAPTHLDPGSDPMYAVPKEPVTLRFRSSAASHHLQILGVGSQEVLLERDLGGPPALLVLPWEGTFRWRVAARDSRGIEGAPSSEGLIAAVSR